MMSDELVDPEPDFDTHELTYAGKVDPQVGSFLGPGLDHRIWRVNGTSYDKITDKSQVSLESERV